MTTRKRRWSKEDEEWLSPRVRKKRAKELAAATGDRTGATKNTRGPARSWPEEDQAAFFERVVARKAREKGGADPHLALVARLLRHRGGLMRLAECQDRREATDEAHPAFAKLDLVEHLLRRIRAALSGGDEERADACRRVDGVLDALLGETQFATLRWIVALSLLEQAGDLVRRELRGAEAPDYALAFSVVTMERLSNRTTPAAEAWAVATLPAFDERLLPLAVKAFASTSANGAKWRPVHDLLKEGDVSRHDKAENLRIAYAGIRKRGGLPVFLRERFPGYAEAFETSPYWRLHRP